MWVGMVGQGEYQQIPAVDFRSRYASSITREIACVLVDAF